MTVSAAAIADDDDELERVDVRERGRDGGLVGPDAEAENAEIVADPPPAPRRNDPTRGLRCVGESESDHAADSTTHVAILRPLITQRPDQTRPPIVVVGSH